MKELFIVIILFFNNISLFSPYYNSIKSFFISKTYSVELVAVGDIMVHQAQLNIAYSNSTQKYDFSSSFLNVKDIFLNADIVIGNLETSFGGGKYRGYPLFNSPDILAQNLKDIGFDILTTANNHCLDNGFYGLCRTIDILDSIEIFHTGTFDDSSEEILFIKKNNISFVFLSYTYGTNGIPIPNSYCVNLIDTSIIHRDIIRAESLNPDFIIVSLHYGQEYQIYPSDNQREISKEIIMYGADIILGSHPHVLQPFEEIIRNDSSKAYILYSLGNFISSQRTKPRDIGVIASFVFEKKNNNKIINISFIPTLCRFYYENNEYENNEKKIEILNIISTLQDSSILNRLTKQEIDRLKEVNTTISQHIYFYN